MGLCISLSSLALTRPNRLCRQSTQQTLNAHRIYWGWLLTTTMVETGRFLTSFWLQPTWITNTNSNSKCRTIKQNVLVIRVTTTRLLLMTMVVLLHLQIIKGSRFTIWETMLIFSSSQSKLIKFDQSHVFNFTLFFKLWKLSQKQSTCCSWNKFLFFL